MSVSQLVRNFYLFATDLFNDAFKSSDKTFETIVTSVEKLRKP